MRVISGKAKGIKLESPEGLTTRPTTDRVKESLFNIIQKDLQDAHVLDLYAGSGAIGIEALSRGAHHCIFLDIDKKAVQTIKNNLEKTKLADLAEVRNTDAFGFIRQTSKKFDIIYVDPPRYEDSWSRVVYLISERPDVLNENGKILVEIDPKEYEPLVLASFIEVEKREYGSTMLVQFQKLAPK
ncbi:MAG: 16S rRNA (guanine(966)-N(2))-methyltransferase RsmD [Bdellovibrionales bacterium]|nr:16S rRNA (guanine(966)-N(2))-methyltransferase RsmD [Bdellovibrionales bacterium]